MIHDEMQVASLRNFVEKVKKSHLSYDEIYNLWIQHSCVIVHDYDTAIYYLSLIPLFINIPVRRE